MPATLFTRARVRRCAKERLLYHRTRQSPDASAIYISSSGPTPSSPPIHRRYIMIRGAPDAAADGARAAAADGARARARAADDESARPAGRARPAPFRCLFPVFLLLLLLPLPCLALPCLAFPFLPSSHPLPLPSFPSPLPPRPSLPVEAEHSREPQHDAARWHEHPQEHGDGRTDGRSGRRRMWGCELCVRRFGAPGGVWVCGVRGGVSVVGGPSANATTDGRDATHGTERNVCPGRETRRMLQCTGGPAAVYVNGARAVPALQRLPQATQREWTRPDEQGKHARTH
ncbi:hypothetical protein B0H15DRAFT_186939 [Mycena belliarum]|uniref:Uncharacterized protein n=1 Tax=Mycena belliarum TaxID=1033014 RepID=A0AAD6XQK1_9AGAR|nr:hypothetical protein B0H15DRAFT_186939 [Mycena belliae]